MILCGYRHQLISHELRKQFSKQKFVLPVFRSGRRLPNRKTTSVLPWLHQLANNNARDQIDMSEARLNPYSLTNLE
jgi:hypothetical protein